jgi:hypothetical protein
VKRRGASPAWPFSSTAAKPKTSGVGIASDKLFHLLLRHRGWRYDRELYREFLARLPAHSAITVEASGSYSS